MSEHPADWYPDPAGRHEHRYWDGARWTENVSDHGRTGIDPIVDSAPLPTTGMSKEKIQDQAERAGVAGASVAGAVLDQQVLVVNQKVKLIEVNSEFAVYDASGEQIAAIRQVGQNALKKAARFLEVREVQGPHHRRGR
ncbi:MAG: DUF2510 domain-containing protein [Actinomycetota bacterium]